MLRLGREPGFPFYDVCPGRRDMGGRSGLHAECQTGLKLNF